VVEEKKKEKKNERRLTSQFELLLCQDTAESALNTHDKNYLPLSKRFRGRRREKKKSDNKKKTFVDKSCHLTQPRNKKRTAYRQCSSSPVFFRHQKTFFCFLCLFIYSQAAFTNKTYTSNTQRKNKRFFNFFFFCLRLFHQSTNITAG
jgi:hypothetical protein